MGLYINPNSNRIVIKAEDITYFTQQLKKFVDTYFNDIFIFNSDDLRTLDVLDKIADALIQKRYDEIFERNVDIDYGDDLLIELPF